MDMPWLRNDIASVRIEITDPWVKRLHVALNRCRFIENQSIEGDFVQLVCVELCTVLVIIKLTKFAVALRFL